MVFGLVVDSDRKDVVRTLINLSAYRSSFSWVCTVHQGTMRIIALVIASVLVVHGEMKDASRIIR